MSEPFISQQVQPKYTSMSLFKNRAFLFLWLSSTSSFLALSTYLFAEQWYVIRSLGQESALGIVMMVTLIPRVLLMTVGGVWADRFKRSKIMLVSSFTRFYWFCNDYFITFASIKFMVVTVFCTTIWNSGCFLFTSESVSSSSSSPKRDVNSI